MNNRKLKFMNPIKMLFLTGALCAAAFAQSPEPKPGEAKSVKIPAVKEFTLKNGLKVAVANRPDVPLVSVTLLVKGGAVNENPESAGLADMTLTLLTKGTKTRSATDVAEQIEFLGASLNSGAGWNSSTVSLNVMSDKLPDALAIMADSVLKPAFVQEEIDLSKSQTLDGLTYNLTQPGFLSNYVASAYSFDEHPASGTPDSIQSISQEELLDFHKVFFTPKNCVLIFAGDISEVDARKLTEKFFGSWKSSKQESKSIFESPTMPPKGSESKVKPIVQRLLVVDLPNSGQAAVSYAVKSDAGRITFDGPNFANSNYFNAIVLNSLLGGGYSSRLNQEIRIKRGLSYGAGSSFASRDLGSNFSTRTQTKNESAAEVAELVVTELKRLQNEEIADAELTPRKLVLTGGFGRNLETNNGLSNAIADLYTFGLPVDYLNSYMGNVMSIKDSGIRSFAAKTFLSGDIIIVGDYAKFKDDLAKRFPNITVDVVKADELDISKEDLRK